jgi:hypothetical protein
MSLNIPNMLHERIIQYLKKVEDTSKATVVDIQDAMKSAVRAYTKPSKWKQVDNTTWREWKDAPSFRISPGLLEGAVQSR